MKRVLLPVVALLLASCGGAAASNVPPGAAGSEGNSDQSLCAAAQAAWHDANSAAVSVDQTKADEDAVVAKSADVSGLTYQATVEAAGTLYADAQGGNRGLIVRDIAALHRACRSIPR